MSFWHYLHPFVEVNRYTLYLLIFVLFLPFLKFIRLPKFSTRQWMLFILGVAFVLRLGWLGFCTYTPKAEYGPQILESDITNILAKDVSEGKWFINAEGLPSARRPIGYPIFLGAFYKLLGYSPYVAYAVNLALHLWTVFLLYLIGKRIFNERAGLLTAFLFAIYPMSIYSIKLITDEHLFLPVWFWGLYWLVREIQGEKLRRPILWYGLIFGFAAMTRTYAIFMPFVVAFAYLLMKKNWSRILLGFVGTLLFMQLINLPWVIRNYKIWDKPLLYTASSRALYDSLRPGALPEKGVDPKEGYPEDLARVMKEGNQAVINQVAGRKINEWIMADPLAFAVFGAKRYLCFMGLNRDGVWATWYLFTEGAYDAAKPYAQWQKDSLEEAYYISYYILFFVFLFSLILIGRKWNAMAEEKRNAILMFLSCFACWSAFHFAIYPFRKYRYPLEAIMLLFAAFFMDYFIHHFGWTKFGRPTPKAIK